MKIIQELGDLEDNECAVMTEEVETKVYNGGDMANGLQEEAKVMNDDRNGTCEAQPNGVFDTDMEENTLKDSPEVDTEQIEKQANSEDETSTTEILENSPTQGEVVQETDQKTSGDDVQETDQKTSGDDVQETDQKTSGDDVQETDQRTPGDDVQETDQRTPGDDVQETDQRTPGDDVQETDQMTPGDDVQKSDQNTPGEAVQELDQNTPGDAVQEPDKETPGEAVQEPDKETPGDAVQELDQESPGDDVQDQKSLDDREEELNIDDMDVEKNISKEVKEKKEDGLLEESLLKELDMEVEQISSTDKVNDDNSLQGESTIDPPLTVDLKDDEGKDKTESKSGEKSNAPDGKIQKEPNYSAALQELKKIDIANKNILEEPQPQKSVIKRRAESNEELHAKKMKIDEDKTKKHIKKHLLFHKLSRSQLEDMLLQKVVDSITNHKVIGELRKQVDSFQTTSDLWKRRANALSKQCADLNTVMRKYITESKSGKEKVAPVRITRSVGLQVLPPEKRQVAAKLAAAAAVSQSSSVHRTPPGAGQVNGSRGMRAVAPGAAEATAPRQVSRSPAAAGKGPASTSHIIFNRPQKQIVSISTSGPNNTVVRKQPTLAPKPPTPASTVIVPVKKTPEVVDIDLSDDESPPAVSKPVTTTTISPASITVSQQVLVPRPATIISARPVGIANPVRQMVSTGVNRIRLQAIARPNQAPLPVHPAPLPGYIPPTNNPNWRSVPPKPKLRITRVQHQHGIVLSWNIPNYNFRDHEIITSYQLFAYQEEGRGRVDSSVWKKVGDVKALPLPMACTLTQFLAGNKYHFAVRAADGHSRFGAFSDPESIIL